MRYVSGIIGFLFLLWSIPGCDLVPPMTLNDAPLESSGVAEIKVTPASENSQKSENFLETLIHFQKPKEGGQPPELYNFEDLTKNGRALTSQFKTNANPFWFPKLKPAQQPTEPTPVTPTEDPELAVDLSFTSIVFMKGVKMAAINGQKLKEGDKIPKTEITVIKIDTKKKEVTVKTKLGNERVLKQK